MAHHSTTPIVDVLMSRTGFLNTASSVLLCTSLCSAAQSASMDDYVTCGLVYGALLRAAKNAGHAGMLSYSRPRLQAVTPYLQENKDNPVAKAKLRETAIRLEDEIRYKFVQRATDAINERDPEKLKATMERVFQCDKAFGLSTLPLPLEAKPARSSNKFLDGFHAGCLAKQKSAPSPISDTQIQRYCSCMTDRASSAGIDASSSEAETGRVVSQIHGACLASVR